jgi:phage terminase large subunit-like protein
MECSGNVAIARGEEVYLGLDLAASLDLTALVMVSASDPARVMPFFWKPADTLAEHSDRDFGVGNHRYREWQQSGHLFAAPGNCVDPEIVARMVAELFMHYKVKGLAYDRWRMDVLLRWIDCANQEAKLTSTLAQKVTTAKSVPETTAACQEWVSQQIELFSSQARKTIDATQDFTKACSQIVSDGKRD